MMRARVIDVAAVVAAVGAVGLCAQRAASEHPMDVHGLAIMIAVAAVVPILVASALVSREIRLERRLRAASLPGRVSGVPVRWLDADSPFVAGIIRPTIYWPKTFTEPLSPRELRAVVLHEEHHRRHAAPRRLLVLRLAGLLAPTRSLRRGLDVLRAQLEIEADRGAIAAGATRGSLASALLRLAPIAPSPGAGFTAAAELRVRDLLGESVGPGPRCPRWSSLASAVVVSLAVVCLVIAG